MSPLLHHPEPHSDALLQRWTDAFAAFYGAPIAFAPFDGPAGAPGPSETITLPVVPERRDALGSTGHFKHMPRMIEHVRRLGFGWNDEGAILTMPTPATFNALLEAVAGAGHGFKVVYLEEDRPSPSSGPALRAYLEGFVPLHVGSAAFYAECLADGPKGKRAKGLPFHLAGLGHGLSVYALNYHFVPRDRIAALAARIREHFGEEVVASWGAPDSKAPATLTHFFRSDLNRYAYALWARASHAEQLVSLFCHESLYAQLTAALERRLRETDEGKGETRGDELPDLQPFSFEMP